MQTILVLHCKQHTQFCTNYSYKPTNYSRIFFSTYYSKNYSGIIGGSLARDKLVNGYPSRNFVLCQLCVDGKIHKKQFSITGGKRANKPLELIHSDVCGKVRMPSFSYFLTFIDDKYTRNFQLE